MTGPCNVIELGATRKGKTLAAARAILEATHEAAVVLDPHKHSLAEAVVTHASSNILYERLSDIRLTLGFDLLKPSAHRDPFQRQLENQRRAEAFVEILLRRRNVEGLAATPLLEEWVTSAINLFLFQTTPKPLIWLPSAFLPGTDEFTALVRDCTTPEIRHKFQQLEKLSPRGQRAEIGSAIRLVNPIFRSPAFAVRSRGGFNLGGFLQSGGKLVIEKGDEVGEDTMRVIMGAIVLLTIDHAKHRPKPYPPIRITIDEATNARLVGGPELRGIAETNKNGLYWTFLVQDLDLPGGADAVLQNCHRHEYFGCPNYELARKAATDVVAGLPWSEESRAERIANLTTQIMNLQPGWRWVRDAAGSRLEYVPLLESGWPRWPGLHEAKLKEKLEWIYARPEYGAPSTPLSTTSSAATSPPPDKSRPSSPAERWRRGSKKPVAGSSSNDAAAESM